MRKLVIALGLAATLGTASAQQPEPEIVVTAERLHEMVRSFVAEVAVAPQAENQIARWDRRVCTRLAGMPQRQAQFVVDRIAQRAHQVDLEPGGPGCQVNVLVFVTPDSDRFAQAFAEEYRIVLDGGREPNMITAGSDKLDEFVATSRPVRWWHVMQTVDETGIVVRNTQPRLRAGELTGLSIVRIGGLAGRTERPTRQDFNRVIVIVDATMANGVRLDALSDYIAMTALAQLDPNADTSSNNTILNLFRSTSTATPTAMTEWDLAYLQGLYDMRRNATVSARQRADYRPHNGKNAGDSDALTLPLRGAGEKFLQRLQRVGVARAFVPANAGDAREAHGDAGFVPGRTLQAFEGDF